MLEYFAGTHDVKYLCPRQLGPVVGRIGRRGSVRRARGRAMFSCSDRCLCIIATHHISEQSRGSYFRCHSKTTAPTTVLRGSFERARLEKSNRTNVIVVSVMVIERRHLLWDKSSPTERYEGKLQILYEDVILQWMMPRNSFIP